jgi:uroporphyrinogen decarboxylase
VPLLVRACQGQRLPHTPVWFMRQAGRSLPEYRAVRERYDLLAICRRPELCAEVTLQPVRRLDVDAAVMFADIMLPLLGMGVDLELVENVGPVITDPIRTLAQVQRLRRVDPQESVSYVLDSIRLVRRELEPARAVIGFAGAPFTLAGYLIEGKPSREFALTKQVMYQERALWDTLAGKLADLVATYLRAQVEAGVDVVQIFDSWVGCLSSDDYREYVLPWMRRIFTALEPLGVPVIHFGTGTAALLPLMREAGGDVFGVDWRLPIELAWERVGTDRGIQGNLDPARVLASFEAARAGADRILRAVGGRPGHIFNLGHGVHPETPLENLQRLVAHVHAQTAA